MSASISANIPSIAIVASMTDPVVLVEQNGGKCKFRLSYCSTHCIISLVTRGRWDLALEYLQLMQMLPLHIQIKTLYRASAAARG